MPNRLRVISSCDWYVAYMLPRQNAWNVARLNIDLRAALIGWIASMGGE